MFKFNLFPKINVKESNGTLDIRSIVLMCKDGLITKNVDKFRETKEQRYKRNLPSFTPMGRCKDESNPVRSIETMEPTGFCMIDLDKMGMAYEDLKKWSSQWLSDNGIVIESLNTILVYITCSGQGLRVVFPLFKNTTIRESAVLYCQQTNLPLEFLDKSIIDISRLSILTKWEDVLYVRDVVEDENEVPIFNLHSAFLFFGGVFSQPLLKG